MSAQEQKASIETLGSLSDDYMFEIRKLEAKTNTQAETIKTMREIIEKFITKSNGLSFYVRDEFEADKLLFNDNLELHGRLKGLYDFQCDVEAALRKLESK